MHLSHSPEPRTPGAVELRVRSNWLASIWLFFAGAASVAAAPPTPREIFDQADKNNDGSLTVNELDPGARPLFPQADANGNGSISLDEFVQFLRTYVDPNATETTVRKPEETVRSLLDIAYADTNHPRQRLDLFVPKSPRSKSLPLIVYIHGGGWVQGDKEQGRPLLSAIGRVLGALESHGSLDDTLVIYFNDNGGRKDNPPFRGGKGDTYEGGVRVNCIIRWPGRVPAGANCDGLAHVVDLYPTLVNLAGGSLDQPLPLDGRDLWDMLANGAAAPRTEVVLSVPGAADSDTGVPAIRQENWKLVGEELFDLGQDPGETTDVSSQQPDVVRTLRQRLADLARERRTPEVHTNISKVTERPLLVFGEEENESPPAWLAEYVRKHGEPKERQRDQ